MHMADALISPAVGGAMLAAGGAALVYSVAQSKKQGLIDEKKAPVMGVMSAFVFAAQMINFTIPLTGSSGHIGGGILLAAVLGGSPSLLAITAVLLIQALFFADGGLLALGCNIFNMGVIPCLVAYPLIFKPIMRKGWSVPKIVIASLLSSIAALQLGSLGVVLQTTLSGITALPFSAFLLLMQPVHLAIGAVEGAITAAILVFVYRMRPELLESAAANAPLDKGAPLKKVLAVIIVATILVGGGLSIYASALPDGLEWSVAGVTEGGEIEASGGIYEDAQKLQEKTSFMPDYSFKNSGGSAGTTVAGLAGGAITLVIAAGTALLIAVIKKRKGKGQEGC